MVALGDIIEGYERFSQRLRFGQSVIAADRSPFLPRWAKQNEPGRC
jgi:hypothetical protein